MWITSPDTVTQTSSRTLQMKRPLKENMALKGWQPHMASSSSNDMLPMESSGKMPGSKTTKSAPIHS